MAENQTLDNAPAIDPDEPWLALRSAIEAEDKAQLTAIFEELTLSEGLRALLQLEAEERARVLTLLPPELAAELIEEAPNIRKRWSWSKDSTPSTPRASSRNSTPTSRRIWSALRARMASRRGTGRGPVQQ